MDLSKFQELVEDKGAWNETVHGVTKSQRWLSNEMKTIIQYLVLAAMEAGFEVTRGKDLSLLKVPTVYNRRMYE